MRSTCDDHARYVPSCATCKVRRREYQAAYRALRAERCAYCRAGEHYDCTSDACSCGAAIHRNRPGFGRAASLPAPSTLAPALPEAAPAPARQRATRPAAPAPPKPKPAHRAAALDPPRRIVANKDAAPHQVAALEVQLARLRRWEADNDVYREMLAAAITRALGGEPLVPTGPRGFYNDVDSAKRP
jgi:cell division septation protein DedD